MRPPRIHRNTDATTHQTKQSGWRRPLEWEYYVGVGLRGSAIWARILRTDIEGSTFKSVPRGWQGVNCAGTIRKAADLAPCQIRARGFSVDGVAI